MIYKIDISKQAQADLRGIYEYIAYTLLSPQSTAEQLDRLEEHIMGLNQMSMRFVLENMKENRGNHEACE